MRSGFFARIARQNVRKNVRFFVPQMLTGMGLLACFYIVFTLYKDKRLQAVRGGDYLPAFMMIGVLVIGLLSVILILYTNSFLMRQRKREYGLYNVLGMEKRHVCRVLFHEMLISGGVSILGGLGLGMLMYKLCALLICRLFRTEIVLGFYFITPATLIPSALFFVFVYLLAYGIDCLSISRLKPVDLLSSRNVGEREPKVKWPIFLLGILTLAGGYVLAIVTRDPLEAILYFFVAVFLVIIGTYCLFTAGSIFILKLLKKNRRFYYRKRHFTAVSGMLYRMKQNAVGLASICILATGVLTMISSTVSLYSGMQDTLQANYPQHLYLIVREEVDGELGDPVPYAELDRLVREVAAEHGVTVKSTEEQTYLSVSYLWQGQSLLARSEAGDSANLGDVSTFTFLTNDMYEHLTGRRLDLTGNEIAACRISSEADNLRTPSGDLTIHGTVYHVKEELLFFPISNGMTVSLGHYGIVVADEAVLSAVYEGQKAAYGQYCSEYTGRIAVTYEDPDAVEDVCDSMLDDMSRRILDSFETIDGHSGGLMSLDTVWYAKESIVGMYGTFLFLGIILGTVCLFATTLIIYYKQISEGYEDRERYQIMEKVGMTEGEVKSSIRSQIIPVFFLPLVVAGVHTCFAFPIINRLLHVLLLSDTRLFVISSLVTYGVFALIYFLIYRGTAKTYLKIIR